MALLLQGCLRVSDAEAVRLSETDRYWRMVLGTLEPDDDAPAFSQGGLQQFRERLIHNDLERRLLDRTVEVAQKTKAFDWKKLPATLRLAVDSRPLKGAGRVEDTFNLLGHASKRLAEGAARLMSTDVEEVCLQAKAPLLLGTSVKAALDIDWSDAEEKQDALNRQVRQVDRLAAWVARHVDGADETPLHCYIEALGQVKA